ncbi:MAG: trypsin-like peptidase domain-containing protein [Alphaproteobacteria bacterium]|nr:trypsin-like peptidase domain-containing protein [Alphaproteobacteria bacterium]
MIRCKTLFAIGWLAVSSVAPGMAQAPPVGLAPREPGPAMSAADLIAAVMPAVVNISTLLVSDAKDANSGQPPKTVHGFGSGFVVDKSGVIVTNRHVVERAARITVTLQDQTTLPATIIGHLSIADLALLRVNPAKPLPVLTWGDSDRMRVGDPVIAIGNPLGLGGSVSSGIISGLNRDIRTTPFDDFIQTDAAINHGSSGGPLFDMQGHVIGVNTAIFSPSATSGSIGISFALPASIAEIVTRQTLRYGRARAGWIGVRLQSVTPDIADALGLHSTGGAVVLGVERGSPAAEADIRQGDVITSIDGFSPDDARALWRAIALAPIDRPAELTLWREGKTLTVQPVVKLIPEPPYADPTADPAIRRAAAMPFDPGLKLATLTQSERARYKLASDVKGVLVTDVVQYSLADMRGITAGEVIELIGQQPVSRPAEVRSRIEAARKQKQDYILLLLTGHAAGERFVTLPLHPGS